MGKGAQFMFGKSFNPENSKNREAVARAERAALDERKKAQEIADQRAEERAQEKIQRELEAAGGKKRVNKVEWMYQGPTDGNGGVTEEQEAYLLGKRSIAPLIKGTEHEKLKKDAGAESFMALQQANTARDTAAKVRGDPLLAMKRKEQEAMERMMKDPARRKMMMAAQGVEEPEEKRRRHRHRHRRRSSSGSRSRSPRRRHRDDERGSTRRRRRHDSRDDKRRERRRYRSPEEGDTRRRRHDSRSDDEREPRRRPRSPSPDRRRSRVDEKGSRRRQHSVSPDRRRDYERDSRRRLSPSPDRGPYNGDRHSNREHKSNDRFHDRPYNDRSRHNDYPVRRHNGNHSSSTQKDTQAEEEERARKLAAMQSNASDLDTSREKRLAELEAQEREARERDDKMRERAGDRGFVNGLHRKGAQKDMERRMERRGMVGEPMEE